MVVSPSALTDVLKVEIRDGPFWPIGRPLFNFQQLLGRFRAGKSSLAHYFTFQTRLKDARCIDVDEPKIYEEVLDEVASKAGSTSTNANPRIVAIWEHALWSLVFAKYKDQDQYVADIAQLNDDDNWCTFIKRMFMHLLDKFLDDRSGRFSSDLEAALLSPGFLEAKRRVLELTRKQPVIIAIDSLEKYAVNDIPMMRATAALIEAASNISLSYARDGIHIKLFVSSEIFPHLSEVEISNYSKFVQNPVYLYWSPRDLVRLVCWRFNQFFLNSTNPLQWQYREDVNWESSRSVVEKVWNPLFGQTIRNGNGRQETTIGYVMRHTQLRPRQFILFCNLMAKKAQEAKTFPKIGPESILSAVEFQEKELAKEILNSYTSIFPNIEKIIRALSGAPIVLAGNEIDRRAPSSASQWPQGDYSPFRFREIMAELGVLGRVRERKKDADGLEYVIADFEYALDDRLHLSEGDECVVHPMFFKKLNIDTKSRTIVYPFGKTRDIDYWMLSPQQT